MTHCTKEEYFQSMLIDVPHLVNTDNESLLQYSHNNKYYSYTYDPQNQTILSLGYGTIVWGGVNDAVIGCETVFVDKSLIDIRRVSNKIAVTSQMGAGRLHFFKELDLLMMVYSGTLQEQKPFLSSGSFIASTHGIKNTCSILQLAS